MRHAVQERRPKRPNSRRANRSSPLYPPSRKPQVEVFERLLNRYRVSAARAVYVDDTEEFVAGARRAGMYGICFAGAAELQRRLNELGLPLEPTRPSGGSSPAPAFDVDPAGGSATRVDLRVLPVSTRGGFRPRSAELPFREAAAFEPDHGAELQSLQPGRLEG